MNSRGKLPYFGAMVALGVVGLMGSVGMADTVVLTQSGYSSGQGGEFTATLNPGAGGTLTSALLALPPQSSSTELPGDTSANGIFQTFCVQAGPLQPAGNGVYFTPTVSYTASFNSPNTDNPGPLLMTAGVSYLYDQFWRGTLDGYNFNNDPVSGSVLLTRAQDAGALQAVIWDLIGDESGVLANGYVEAGVDPSNTAQVAIAQHWLAETIGKAPVASVEFLNLQIVGSNPNDMASYAQTQLVEVANPGAVGVPLPASAGVGFSMLGGFGALFAFRKRLARRPRIA